MAAGTDATGATTAVVRAYFDRLERGELDAPREGYAPDARITIHGVLEEASREELAAWFEGLRDAMPDVAFAVLDVTAEGDRAVVRWRATGTFAGPGRLLGFEATGAAVALEGHGGARYLRLDRLRSPMRILLPRVLIPLWDGGPVTVAGTLAEGDDVAGFRVVELPGHAPGLIGLWREADRLALASDAVYTLNPQSGRRSEPRLAPRELNHDTDRARASMRRLAALEPATVWPAHGDALTGDAARRLERAAALA